VPTAGPDHPVAPDNFAFRLAFRVTEEQVAFYATSMCVVFRGVAKSLLMHAHIQTGGGSVLTSSSCSSHDTSDRNLRSTLQQLMPHIDAMTNVIFAMRTACDTLQAPLSGYQAGSARSCTRPVVSLISTKLLSLNLRTGAGNRGSQVYDFRGVLYVHTTMRVPSSAAFSISRMCFATAHATVDSRLHLSIIPTLTGRVYAQLTRAFMAAFHSRHGRCSKRPRASARSSRAIANAWCAADVVRVSMPSAVTA
jgi:hypothetical protein